MQFTTFIGKRIQTYQLFIPQVNDLVNFVDHPCDNRNDASHKEHGENDGDDEEEADVLVT